MVSEDWTKAIVLLSLFVLTFTFSLIPLRFRISIYLHRHTHDTYHAILSLLNCFAAGVFFATCIMDLFPEVQDKLAQAFDEFGIASTFPIAEFVMSFGLFLIMTVEQTVITLKSTSQATRTPPVTGITTYGSNQSRNAHQTSINGSGIIPEDNMDEHQCLLTSDPEVVNNGRLGDGGLIEEDSTNHNALRSLLLILALSLHSVFEGLAVGLQPTSDEVLQIFAALVLHKCILAFSLGLTLIQSNLSLGAIIRSILLFAVTAPLGIMVGILIDDLASDSTAATLADGVLQGIACGTFVYIVFLEILPYEFSSTSDHPNRILKMLCLILGFSAVVAILFIHPDNNRPICQYYPLKTKT